MVEQHIPELVAIVLGGKRGLTTLSGNNSTFAKCTVEELEIGLLEESLGGTLWVAGVGDDDIKLVLLVLEELESVANNGLHLGVVETDRHAGEKLLRKTDDSLQ